MTIQIDGTDITSAIEIAAFAGGILVMLLIGLLLYLMVRPPRHARKEKADAGESEEMLRLMERMEQRLAALERAIEPEKDRPEIAGSEMEKGERARDIRRIK